MSSSYEQVRIEPADNRLRWPRTVRYRCLEEVSARSPEIGRVVGGLVLPPFPQGPVQVVIGVEIRVSRIELGGGSVGDPIAVDADDAVRVVTMRVIFTHHFRARRSRGRERIH